MGLGSFISGIFGSNNKEADQVNPYNVDPNAYQYGGRPGGAQQAADLQGQRAQGSVDYGNALQGQQAQMFGQGNLSLAQGQQSRGDQEQALDMARQRAMGQNLISSQITAQQQQQAAAQQNSQAASARGPAALALAQQNAAANIGQAQAQLGAQGAIAGAQEQLANQQAFAQQAAGIRGQDIGTAQTNFGAGTQSGQLALGNQQVAQGWAGLQNNINQAQLAAQMNQQAQQSANYNAAHGIQAGAAGQNASTAQQNGLALLGAVASGGSTFMGGGGGKAVGGSLPASGRPYLVGEKGAELVAPKRDGFVMTALQTSKLLGAPPTAQQLASLSPGQRRQLAEMRAPARANGGQLKARAPAGPLLTRGPDGPVPGDPNAPRMQFDPRVGWYNPSLPPNRKAELDAAIAAQAAQDAEYADQDRRIATLPAKSDPERVKRFVEEDVQAAKAKKGESPMPSIIEIIGREEGGGKGRMPRVQSAVRGIGDALLEQSGRVDTGYHAADTYRPPTLVALPEAREAGGDFDAGNGVVLKKTGGMDLPATYAATQEISMSGMKNASSNPSWNGSGALGAAGDAFTNAAKGVDVSYRPVEAREEGGSILSAIATHATRALHGIASAAADATAPEPIAVERKAPRAGVTERTGYSATGTGHGAAAPTTATLIHPGPETAPKKVVSGDDERAYGGPMLARGGKRRKAA